MLYTLKLGLGRKERATHFSMSVAPQVTLFLSFLLPLAFSQPVLQCIYETKEE